MASKKRDRLPQNRQPRIGKQNRGNPNPTPPPVEHQFKSRDENGGELDPRINVGGRPKLLGESYKAWLEKTQPGAEETNAELVARAMGLQAIKGDVSAAREIRSATEPSKMELTGAGGGPVQVEDINVTREKRWQQFAPTLAAAMTDGNEHLNDVRPEGAENG